MYKIDAPAQLIEQVYEAILDAICDGTLAPNARITQEGLAETLGVSRQPILQAFHLLKRQGFIEESGRKGVIVTPIDPQKLVQLYQVRSALDGLAAREAALKWKKHPDEQAIQQGLDLLTHGRRAGKSGVVAELIKADMHFHQFIYQASGNPMIAETTALHWQHIRRAMGAILRNDAHTRTTVWDEHEAILDAIINGKAGIADNLARQHAERAAGHLATMLMSNEYASQRQQVAAAGSASRHATTSA